MAILCKAHYSYFYGFIVEKSQAKDGLCYYKIDEKGVNGFGWVGVG